ncbi:unnamed protein product, partial [Brassica rapa]
MSVQYTQDVCGSPPAHTGPPWLSACVRQHTQDVCGCPSVHISARWSLDSARWPFPWTVWVILSHVGCLFSTHRTSVGVRQHTQDHTQDVCGCPSVHISARWSLDSARWPFPWTVWVILAHVGYLFSTHRTSMGVRQHTQDVCGCPYMSVCVRQHTKDVCGCPSVFISARWSLDSARWSLDLARWPFPWTVWYTQDVCGRPSVHISACWSMDSARWPFPWTVW